MKPFLFFLAICLASPVFSSPTEVPKGSDLRSYLFELARATVVQEAGRQVRFAGSLKQLDGWAFFNGSIVDESGNKIPLGDAESADTVILWKKSGGEWDLVKCAVGITGVCYESWPRKYGAPVELLFPEN